MSKENRNDGIRILRRYDEQFKKGIAELCVKSGYAPIELSRKLNIPTSSVYYWIKRYGSAQPDNIKIDLIECSEEGGQKQSELECELYRIDTELEAMRKEREEIVAFFGNLFGLKKGN